MTQLQPTLVANANPKAVIDKLIPIYTEIATLTEDAKSVLDDAKEKGLDAPMLAKIAKAKANSKLSDLHDKTEELLAMIELVE